MADSKIILKDDDFYVGERLWVEVRLFDELGREAATGLSPLLSFRRPSKTSSIVASMVEVAGNPGLYRGSAVVDIEGVWSVSVTVSGESVFRHDHLYVSA